MLLRAPAFSLIAIILILVVIREILRRYETSLVEGRFVDRSELLRRATEALASKTGSAAMYLLPDASDLSGLERFHLQRPPGGQRPRRALGVLAQRAALEDQRVGRLGIDCERAIGALSASDAATIRSRRSCMRLASAACSETSSTKPSCDSASIRYL